MSVYTLLTTADFYTSPAGLCKPNKRPISANWWLSWPEMWKYVKNQWMCRQHRFMYTWDLSRVIEGKKGVLFFVMYGIFKLTFFSTAFQNSYIYRRKQFSHRFFFCVKKMISNWKTNLCYDCQHIFRAVIFPLDHMKVCCFHISWTGLFSWVCLKV